MRSPVFVIPRPDIVVHVQYSYAHVGHDDCLLDRTLLWSKRCVAPGPISLENETDVFEARPR